jgi:hypothetical protein
MADPLTTQTTDYSLAKRRLFSAKSSSTSQTVALPQMGEGLSVMLRLGLIEHDMKL